MAQHWRRSTTRLTGPARDHRGYVEVVTDPTPAPLTPDVHEARRLFPATADRAYLNTAAVGLASRRLALDPLSETLKTAAYHPWVEALRTAR